MAATSTVNTPPQAATERDIVELLSKIHGVISQSPLSERPGSAYIRRYMAIHQSPIFPFRAGRVEVGTHPTEIK